MLNEILHRLQSDAALAGDPQSFLDQLGSAQGLAILATSAAALSLPQPENLLRLRQFLESYRGEILVPVELPAIYRAYQYAHHGAVRELIDLDQSLGLATILKPFALASQRVGQVRLQGLRPLRDQRLVQRYLQTVEKGQAHGWHFLVYGLFLALYSIPIRQGMLGYSQLTLHGFIQSAGHTLPLHDGVGQQLLEELCATIPAELESVLSAHQATGLRSEGSNVMRDT